MSIWTSKPSTSAPAPRSGATPASGWGARPVPKSAPKPVQKPAVKPGILGEHGFSTFRMMNEFAKKAPRKPVPTYGKPLEKQERIEMIKTLQKYSGQFYGLSTGKYEETLNKMKKEKYLAGFKHDYKKIKELDPQIKQLSAWLKAQK